jgi:molybdopterin-guanine dinucleotide biosynthesis protein A
VTGLAAIILAGGRSRRMGQDKAGLLWDGETAVLRLKHLAAQAGASAVFVAGGHHGTPDPTPFGGPVGGLLAAAAHLAEAQRFLILAVDAPTLTLDDLAPLLRAAAPGAAFRGLPLPMVMGSGAVPWEFPADASLRRFVAAAGLDEIAPPAAAVTRLRGANTPEELQQLRSASRLENPAVPGARPRAMEPRSASSLGSPISEATPFGALDSGRN